MMAALATICVVGCKPDVQPEYEIFHTKAEKYTPSAGSGNAYDGYLLAAEAAVKAAPDSKDVVNFRPADREKLIAACGPAVNLAVRASRLPCRIDFQAPDPFLPRTGHDGLTIIGHVLSWRIEAAGQAGNFGQAANDTMAAIKIGCDLTGGDTADAMLGHWMGASARKALAPYLEKLPAGIASELGQYCLKTISEAPSPTTTVDNEQENFLASVQFVQDCYRQKDFKLLHEAMYKEAREAIDYLEGLKASERVQYFRGFASEAKSRAAFYRAEAPVPVVDRKKFSVDDSAKRPWKRFSKQLFETLQPWLDSHDEFVARTKLLGLTCIANAAGKATGAAPASMDKLPEGSMIDPYSGREFPYRTAGREFSIYSVGKDGRDDGGSTDDVGIAPDLTLDPPGS